MARAVHVACKRTMQLTAAEIGAQMLQLENWESFRGYGPLPGIRTARFRRRTEEVVGTQIEVTNDDGSTHVEEVVQWLDSGAISMRMSEFSAPLSRFASHFIERWEFESTSPSGCAVVRRFELYPKSFWGRLLLLLVRPLMRRATDRHLRDLDGLTRKVTSV